MSTPIYIKKKSVLGYGKYNYSCYFLESLLISDLEACY